MNYTQNWSIPYFEQLSSDELNAAQSRGPLFEGTPDDNAVMIQEQKEEAMSLEALNRREALSSYAGSRRNSVVSRIAQLEVEGLRRRERVAVDEQALKNYAYQENDPEFMARNFSRLNRYISANHNDIYIKALRNKASSSVGEKGQNISTRALFTRGAQGISFTGQSSSNLGGIRQSGSYGRLGSGAVSAAAVNNVMSSVRSAGVLSTYGSAPLSVDYSKISRAAQQADSSLQGVLSEGEYLRSMRSLSKDNDAYTEQDDVGSYEAADQSKILLRNKNTFIVTSGNGVEDFESVRAFSEESDTDEVKSAQDDPRTVIQVRESVDNQRNSVAEQEEYIYETPQAETVSDTFYAEREEILMPAETAEEAPYIQAEAFTEEAYAEPETAAEPVKEEAVVQENGPAEAEVVQEAREPRRMVTRRAVRTQSAQSEDATGATPARRRVIRRRR